MFLVIIKVENIFAAWYFYGNRNIFFILIEKDE